ncbi:MAG: 2OG-Fe(II) oxygenase [Candidatus Marinimicrobia bacterium]|nr:2OG-Fe(II) oxygenase [Candidatus Neomarinimicrobiota bacterium]|tara:strand:+ start:18156 stop:18998 length:843 start_codon:yes stop_codon:yes gene_type:complete
MTSGVLTLDFSSPSTPELFVQSLRTTGFGILNNHPIPPDKILNTYQAWESFFQSEIKFKYTFDKLNQDGYFPLLTENAKGNSIKDLKEFYHFYPWGRFPENIGLVTIDLYKNMVEVGSTLLSWIEKYSPEKIKNNFSIPLSEMIHNSKNNLLRIIHYPPITDTQEQGAIRAANHEDINLITILAAGTQPGLEVKDVQGKWHKVSCDPGMLIVNIGDMLELVSENYFPSTTHKVSNPSEELKKKSRYAMPLFLHPRDDVVLSSKHTAKSFLDERLSEIGLK